MAHIRSNEYRRVLTLILRLHDNLPTVVQLRDEDGEVREKQVLYRLTYDPVKGVTLEGHVINSETTNGNELTTVNAEEAFVQNRGFWVGAPSHVYKDYSTERDKKNKLVWAATYEREANFSDFTIDEYEPLMVIYYSRRQLERLNENYAAPAKANCFAKQADRVAEGVKAGTLSATFGGHASTNVSASTDNVEGGAKRDATTFQQ